MKAILITTDNQRRLAFQWNVDEEDLDDRLPIGYWLLAEFGSDTFETRTPELFTSMYPGEHPALENGYVDIDGGDPAEPEPEPDPYNRDDFNRANGPLGSNWVVSSGSGWGIVDGQAVRASGGSDFALWLEDTGSLVHWCEIDVAGPNTNFLGIGVGDDGDPALARNLASASIDPSNGRVMLGVYQDGLFSILAFPTLPVLDVSGEYTMRLEIEFPALRFYHNGVLALSGDLTGKDGFGTKVSIFATTGAAGIREIRAGVL